MEMMLYIGGLLFMLVGLAVSIALHEVGHLVPAKLFGVHVGQYMIGFGPRLWSRRWGSTEYGVKALPLGGYISMAGMYPATADGEKATGMFRTLVQDARDANNETIVDDNRVFYRLSTLKRIIIMLGGPIMNLVLAVVIFTVLLSGVGLQQATTTVSAVAECVLPATSRSQTCSADDPVSPAAQAGLLPGDTIISVGGEPVATFAEASSIVQRSPDAALALVVERGGEQLTLTLTPIAAQRPAVDADGLAVVDDNGDPVMATVGYAGMTSQVEYVRQPILSGSQMAWENAVAVGQIVVTLPQRLWDVGASLVTGGERDPNGPLSVVGVGRIAGEVAATDAPVLNRFVVMLGLLGSLNIALFVFNLIPLLPLDGGHIAVALWDGVRRAWATLRRAPAPRPVDATKLVPITVVVAVALVAMGGLLLIADLINPVRIFG
ncbi:M50 family metallopeptidase [Microbacterium sp. YY-01]|uniref:M50 family metallopeptidase n=1 Tax=Microbacterium sp. YY-01 TaxID=3421634 RepID=UPI003D162F60